MAFQLAFRQVAIIPVILFTRPIEKRDRDDMNQP